MIKKLNEDTSLKFKNISPEEKSKKGILGRLWGPVASFAAPTRNGRHYSQDLWEKLFNSDLIKERFNNGGIFGELCHPDYEDVNMEKIAVVMPEPPVKDNNGNLIAYVDIVDTPCGRIAYQLAKYGYKFGISSRGTGDIIEDYDGNEEVDPDTYQLNAFDLVEIPAVESARLAFVESLDTKKIYNKTLKQRLTEELDGASDADKKIMKDTLKELDIDLDEKLVDPSEKDLQEIEDKFAELGLDIEGKGDTLFGNKHYQLRKELDHKVTKEDLGPIFDALCDLSKDNMPTTCNVGVHRDGDNIISASLDVLKKHVDDNIDEQFYLHSDKDEDARQSLRYNVDPDKLVSYLLPLLDHSELKELCRKYDITTDYENAIQSLRYNIDPDKLVTDLLPLTGHDKLEKLCRKYGITTDVYGKENLGYNDQVNEELEDEDGWGEEIQDHLEPVFAELEALMYEVRNCVRGSYAVKGKEIEDLEAAFDAMSERLEDVSIWLAEDEDALNENMPLDHDEQRKLIGKLYRINQLSDEILSYDREYDFNDEEDQLTINHINDTLEKLKELCAKFNDTTNESCSDNKVDEEDAGDSGDLVDQLQEALLKNKDLEKDNLSLQEKLSVCNAKELKLNEELSKYKKASASLSQTSKKIKDLEEALEESNKKLDYKDKLIESKNERLASLIKSRKESNSKLEESISHNNELEKQVTQLKNQLKDKDTKLSESSAKIIKYQKALKESKERYIDIKTSYLGISKDELKTKLKESYSYKDIDSICNELSDEKRNLSKLPFRINENARFNFKSSNNEYINGNTLKDDEVSDYLLSILH